MTKKRPARKGTPQTNKDFTIDCRVNGPCNGQPEINLTGRRAFESSTVRASVCLCWRKRVLRMRIHVRLSGTVIALYTLIII